MSGHSGVQSDLLNNMTAANNLSSAYGSGAAGISSALTPALTAEAVNPTGYTPTQMAAQTTGAEQAAGGSNAGATGGALLRAARTRNAGAAPAAIDQSSRNAGEDLSQVNAGIQSKNADLQQHQRQAGLSGLENMYGTEVGAGENALGLSTSATNDAGHLPDFWDQLLTQGIQSGGQVASSYVGNH